MLHATLSQSNVNSAGDESRDAAPDVGVRIAGGVPHAINTHWIAIHLQKAVAWLAQREGVEVARLSVLIEDDSRMTHLHERHSGQATTTDVLTFDLRADALQPVEADIVVCADEAARRAAEFKHPLERELLLYCVHGLLHCAGHDDHDDSGWRSMHAREDEILTAIGVGATFAPPSAPAGESEDRA